jgi:hypothetical protein
MAMRSNRRIVVGRRCTDVDATLAAVGAAMMKFLSVLALGLIAFGMIVGCSAANSDVSADQIKQEDMNRQKANEEAAKKSGINMADQDR